MSEIIINGSDCFGIIQIILLELRRELTLFIQITRKIFGEIIVFSLVKFF